MIQFYGAPASSAGRTHLVLEEIGFPYEYHRVNLRDPAGKAAFEAINPGGTIPFLVDGDIRIPESIAINLYLAETYAPALWSATAKGRAEIYAWSLWAITMLQPAIMRVLYHSFLLPAEQRRPEEVSAGKQATQRHLDHLERQLPPAGHLIGDRVSVADLNVASSVNLAASTQAGSLGPKTRAWFDPIKARPAWQKVAAQG